MNDSHGRLGRTMLLRLDAGRPLTALSPAWAALCGLLVSSGLRLDERTVVLSVLLLLLVEPLMGGLWELVANPSPALPAGVGEDALTPAPATGGDGVESILPYAQRGSAGHRVLSALARVGARWREQGWQAFAFVINLAFALAVASVLGLALAGIAAAVAVLCARWIWRNNPLAAVWQAVYDLLLPWLMGMAALGQIAEHGLAPHGSGLLLAGIYTVAYLACLALANGVRLPALLALDATQAAVLGILLARQETAAVWLFGLCLVGQLAAHPGLLVGGKATDFLRRAAVYIVLGMIVASIALAPMLAGG
jgi:hypothetical protein